MMAVMQYDELPQDVAGAEAMLTNHTEQKSEIDAREDNFATFKALGEMLATNGHYASQEVSHDMCCVCVCACVCVCVVCVCVCVCVCVLNVTKTVRSPDLLEVIWVCCYANRSWRR